MDKIIKKYYGGHRLNDDPVRHGIVYGFSDLINGDITPERAAKMYLDADMRTYLDDEDYSTWRKMTHLQ